MKRKLLFILVILSLVLSACGGFGGQFRSNLFFHGRVWAGLFLKLLEGVTFPFFKAHSSFWQFQ